MSSLMNKLNQFFEIAAKSQCYLDIKDEKQSENIMSTVDFMHHRGEISSLRGINNSNGIHMESGR